VIEGCFELVFLALQKQRFMLRCGKRGIRNVKRLEGKEKMKMPAVGVKKQFLISLALISQSVPFEKREGWDKAYISRKLSYGIVQIVHNYAA